MRHIVPLLFAYIISTTLSVSFAVETAEVNSKNPQATLPANEAKPVGAIITQEGGDAATQYGTGKVVEVIRSDNYTYLRVVNGQTSNWLAAYQTDVTKGSTIKYTVGVPLTNFYSQSLNRTFETLTFVTSIELVMP